MHKGHIYFNGQDSYELGIIVEEVPDLSRPQRKHDVYIVPGRSGTIVDQYDAYENIEKKYKIWFADDFYSNLYSPAKAREVAAWLYSADGYQRIEDDFEPDFYRLGYFVGPLDIQNILQKYGKATITFNCRPERYSKNGEDWITASSGTVIKNNFAFTAKPLIKVEGSGNVSFTIQGKTTYIDNLVDYVYIDSDSMDCYRQFAENMNNKMRGVFPELKSGNNQVSSVSSGITALKIQPRFWTL